MAPDSSERPIDLVLSRLREKGRMVKAVGDRKWMAQCPAHKDQRPSLSIREKDSGGVDLHCFAGCNFLDICCELNISPWKLDPPKWLKSSQRTSANSQPIAVYDYHDENNQLLYQICRFPPKKFCARRILADGKAVYNLKNTRLVLYRLGQLVKAPMDQWIFLVEGEKDADRLAKLGLMATTSPFGAGNWKSTYADYLKNRQVAIVPDHDDAGENYAFQAARSLAQRNAQVRIVRLPNLNDKEDVSDWLDKGGTKEELLRLTEATDTYRLEDIPESIESEDTTRKRSQAAMFDSEDDSQADRLVKLALQQELFHDPQGVPYATITINGHKETWPVASEDFRQWLGGCYWRQYGKSSHSQALQDALNVITCHAHHEGPEYPVYVRVAAQEGAYWLDLVNENWQAVRITTDGWEMVDQPPVRFLRRNGMKALPIPLAEGKPDALYSLVNLPEPEDRVLLLAWLAAALRPTGPYPILVVNGEQGSAKSTLCRILRGLVDPNMAPLRSQPTEIRDLMISASNSWVQTFDNMSHLPTWLSDCLCRLSTGGGYATRELYSDDNEKIFQAMRPIILNGIDDLTSRSDLLDRALRLTLPKISADQRRTEKELEADIEAVRPFILGGLLNAVSAAMKRLPKVKLEKIPRMADFAQWAVAAEPGLGITPGAFLRAYIDNREDSDGMVLEASAIGLSLIRFMEDREDWQGTATDLLDILGREPYGDEIRRQRRDWPHTAKTLSNSLHRIAPNLRSIGIQVEFTRKTDRNRTRIIRLAQTDAEEFLTVGYSPSPQPPCPESLPFETEHSDVVRWPTEEMRRLAEWALKLTPADMPAAPFMLRQNVMIHHPAFCLGHLQNVVAHGPTHTHAQSGKLLEELRNLWALCHDGDAP